MIADLSAPRKQDRTARPLGQRLVGSDGALAACSLVLHLRDGAEGLAGLDAEQTYNCNGGAAFEAAARELA